MNLRLFKTLQKFDTGLKKKVAVILLLSIILIPLEFLSIAAVIPLFAAIFETTSSSTFLNIGIFDFKFF